MLHAIDHIRARVCMLNIIAGVHTVLFGAVLHGSERADGIRICLVRDLLESNCLSITSP